MPAKKRSRLSKSVSDVKLSLGDVIFIVQYWHQRDEAWGQMVTEEELVAAEIGIQMRRKMLRTWAIFDMILTPGHFKLEPGERGIGVPRNTKRVWSRSVSKPRQLALPSE